MVRSAASLIRTRGVNATSFSEVLADSGAPRGSIYHHFPQGKEQLAEDAIRWTSEGVLEHQRACRATTPAGVLEHFIDPWRQAVITSNGAAGCPVAGVAVDTLPEAKELMALVRAAFASWIDLLADQLERVGLKKDRARAVALATLAGVEGALILCRAERSVRPLETVAMELKRLAGAGSRSRRRAARP
jgi:TetR/AcrR family transcriptional regulator, lmrAB and yxaGH operons repressor